MRNVRIQVCRDANIVMYRSCDRKSTVWADRFLEELQDTDNECSSELFNNYSQHWIHIACRH